MKLLEDTCSRRKFFRSSSLLIGSVLPSRMLFGKTMVGSSIGFKMSTRDKEIGIKFTNVDHKFIACTIRVPKGKKLLFVLIPRPTQDGKGENSVSLKLESGATKSVKIDTNKAVISTNLENVRISPMQFNDSPHDDVPSAEGFVKWLKGAITDAVRVVAAGLTYLTGNEGDWILEGGTWISVSKSGGFEVSRFKSEGDVDELPGIWY